MLYRRTYFGAAWVVATFLFFSLVIYVVFGAVRGDSSEQYLLFVVYGFLIFQLLSGMITDATMVFVRPAGWMTSTRLPFSVFVYRGVARNVVNLGFSALGAAAVVLWAGQSVGWVSLWALVGLAAIVVNGVWVYLLVGVLCARFRDLQQVVQMFMRVALFLTPVLWMPQDLGSRAVIATYNPLTHFIEIVREPMIAGAPGSDHWQVVLIMTVVGWTAALMAFAYSRRRLVFWI